MSVPQFSSKMPKCVKELGFCRKVVTQRHLPWVSNYFPSRGFRKVCWTRPAVYEILFHENFCWKGQTAGGRK